MAKTYILNALAGREDDMVSALVTLARLVRQVPGCEDVTILRDSVDTGAFIFVERYASAGDHERSASHLPADAFASLKPLLEGKPRVMTAALVDY